MPNDVFKISDYLKGDEEIRVMVERVNAYHRPHAHEFIEVAYIASGKGIHVVNGKKDHVSRGDLILLNANVFHEFTVCADTPLLVYNYLFLPFSLDQVFQGSGDFIEVAYQYLFHSFSDGENPSDYIKLSGIQTGKIEPVLFEIYDEFEKKKPGYRQSMKSLMFHLLILLFRGYKDDLTQSHDGPVYKKLVVSNTIQYLKHHYAEDISLELLANRAYVSTSYFRKAFKEITGVTVISMLQNIRIDAACNLLESTSLPVADIAERVGYSDQKSFYLLFRKVKGHTPGEYRSQQGSSAESFSEDEDMRDGQIPQ